MLIPNTRIQLMRRTPTRTIHGKETFLPPVMIPCAIANLASFVEASTVRADSSASRGSAETLVANAKILVPPSANVQRGDLLSFHGFDLEVIGRQPRLNTQGKLDHHELACKIRSEL